MPFLEPPRRAPRTRLRPAGARRRARRRGSARRGARRPAWPPRRAVSRRRRRPRGWVGRRARASAASSATPQPTSATASGVSDAAESAARSRSARRSSSAGSRCASSTGRERLEVRVGQLERARPAARSCGGPADISTSAAASAHATAAVDPPPGAGVAAAISSSSAASDRSASTENSPTVRPSSSMSTLSAAGDLPRPGICMMSPHSGTTHPAPVYARMSRTWSVKPSGGSGASGPPTATGASWPCRPGSGRARRVYMLERFSASG